MQRFELHRRSARRIVVTNIAASVPRHWLLVPVVLWPGLLGCSAKPVEAPAVSVSASPAATAEVTGSGAAIAFDTPESCWNAMVNAKANGDAVATLNCLAAEDRLALLGSLAFQVERVIMLRIPASQKAADFLKRHGLDGIDIRGTLEDADAPGGVGVNTVFTEVGRKVKDQFAFAKEASGLTASMSKPGNQKSQTGPAITLSNVIINGDTATGVLSANSSAATSPIHFVREDGGWRITSQPKSTGSGADDPARP